MNKPLIISISAAFLVIAAAVIAISFLTEKKEIAAAEDPLKEIERTNNLLKNSSFESPFSQNDWRLKTSEETVHGFDRFSLKNGEFSFTLQQNQNDSTLLSQKIERLEQNKKYIFFGFVKGEEIDSVIFAAACFDKNNKHLFTGYSQTFKSTFDWTMASTWIRTQTEISAYLLLQVAIYGAGRVWLDDFNLYSVPIDYKFNQIPFEKIGK